MKVRQDAWTEENDLLLAETVLRHVREGSTQLNAFEEVGDSLDRTSAACGFRWNSVVRQQYEQSLTLARKQRKQRQRMLGIELTGKKKVLYQPLTLENFESVTTILENQAINIPNEQTNSVIDSPEISSEDTGQLSNNSSSSNFSPPSNDIRLDDVILYLQKFKNQEVVSAALKAENDRLKMEISQLTSRVADLTQQLGSAQKNSNTIQEDYETLINIMNKARKLAMLEEEDRQSTKFKMDRNGNLEKVAE